MKTILMLVSIFLISMLSVFSQVPDAFNYQAVIRNSSGEIISNQNVSFRISILQNSVNGSPVFTETHSAQTNKFGLINLKIGKGTLVSGVFDPGAWGFNSNYVKIEIDVSGGSTFTLLGTSQLLAVPYAFHAKTVEVDNVNDADADATNELQSLSLSGTQLTLSDGGGTVTLPTSGGGDNWGTQTVVSDATLSGNGTTANPLAVNGDLTDDQTLSIKDNKLSISSGNSVLLPTVQPGVWQTLNENIYYNSGKAIIGTNTPNNNAPLTVYGKDGNSWISLTNDATGNTSNDGVQIGPISSNDAVYFWNLENSPIIFATDNKERMIINNDGRVAIGTKNPNTNGVLTIHGGDHSAFLSFNNNVTGNTLNDGLTIGPTSNSVYFWNFENTPIKTAINNDVKMTLTANGYLGIGTETPSAGLHLKGTGYPGTFMFLESLSGQDAGFRLYEGSTAKWHIFNNAASGGLHIYNSDVKTAIFAKQSNSYVGIGTTAPTQALHVVGNAYKTEGGTSWATSSDIRLKNLMGDYSKGLAEIVALKPVRYIYKKDNPRQLDSVEEQVGFVAQEVQKIFPEAVTEGEDGYLDFNIHSINVAMVNAIKELKLENEQLKAKLNNLESRLESMESIVKASASK